MAARLELVAAVVVTPYSWIRAHARTRPANTGWHTRVSKVATRFHLSREHGAFLHGRRWPHTSLYTPSGLIEVGMNLDWLLIGVLHDVRIIHWEHLLVIALPQQNRCRVVEGGLQRAA